MEPFTILTYLMALLLGVIPTMYGYSKKLGIAMTIVYDLMNVTSEFMRGNADHEFTDAEKIALADAVIKLTKDVDANVDVDAILNYNFK